MATGGLMMIILQRVEVMDQFIGVRDYGNVGAGISYTLWTGASQAGGIHFRFETLPRIDLRGTTLVSPNIVDPVFMGTPTLDGQSMIGGQLVYSTSWNENTTTVEYTGSVYGQYLPGFLCIIWKSWLVFNLYAIFWISGSPYIGANDYVSTSEWLEVASTTASLNHGTYAGFEPGLWLSGNGVEYWHNGIYWIIPGAIRNNLGGSTYDMTVFASDAGGPYTPSIMVRGQSYLYRDGLTWLLS